MKSNDSMSAERREELAALLALGALEGAELEEAKACQCCPFSPLQEEVESFEEVVGAMSAAYKDDQPAPPGMKERLRDKLLHQIPQPPSSEQDDAPVPPGFSFIRKNEGKWLPIPARGVSVKELARTPELGTEVMLLSMSAGSRFPSHPHHGIEQAYVISGDLHTAGRVLHAGDFMHADAGTKHTGLYSEFGCQALLITAGENYYPKAIRTYGVFRRLVRKVRGLASTSK